MNIKYINGDLFTSNDNLCHCVSADLHMGAGIAVKFKSKFGSLKELREQKPQVGKCLSLNSNGKYVFYLVTKEKYWQKPTLDSLQKSLISMNNLMNMYNIHTISMPKIGCGLDKLKWTEVSSKIITSLEQKSCTVYYL